MWNDVELLINEDTNTGHFCSVREESSGLYQVDTLVKIASPEKVLSNPQLYASSNSNCSIVVADTTVILFDLSYQTILLHLDFDSNVDAVDVCLDDQFLVVCERNGNLHLIYLPKKKTILTRVRDAADLILHYDGFFHITNLALEKIQTGIAPVKLGFQILFCNYIIINIIIINLLLNPCAPLAWSKNVLSLWDLHFLVMVYCWPDLFIHDFLLITECESASMVTTVYLNGNLQVRSLPSMTVLYSVAVSSVSCLVQTRISMDTIYLLEGIHENSESSAGPITSVVMRCFTEALPENRLSRLLYKHKFEEAEKFAITFELDVELVYKVKLDFVLEQLASVSVGGNGQDICSDLVVEAKTNLLKIMDDQYVVEYCLKAPWPTFDTAEKMLNHAASRCPSQIQEALSRLATFCCVHSLEKFNGIAWIEFLNSSDYIGDVLSHLKEGDLKGAQHLWLRHEFDDQGLQDLLNSIPEDLPSQDLCLWFRSIIVPFVRRVLPRGQKILARWLEQRARILELTEKGDWPQNGLNLAELGLPSMWMWIPTEDDCGSEEVEQVQSLVSNLRQLLDLYNKYHCRLSLSVFEKVVAFLMLDKVPAPELIAATVESSIRPYSVEHQLPLDELLLQYIKDLLERCSSQTTTLFTEWEAKAVALLGCIVDSDVSYTIINRLGQSLDVEKRYLFNYFGNHSGLRLTFCHRSRALLCLIHIGDPTTLETQLHIPKTQVQYYLKCYIYLSQLEALNIPYTLETFLNIPKEGMVKGLWKNHSHEPQAVRLVADLSLEYQVFDLQLWNGLLQKLLGFNMVGRGSLPMLMRPLEQCQRCPFLLNLDLIGIANRFAQFSLTAFALGALLLIPCAKKKEQQIQGLLSTCDLIAILEQVDEHMNTGELAGVPSQVSCCPLLLLADLLDLQLSGNFSVSL
uniref:Kinetochore associated 1 n=1 Tax=Esox lucius TaxID=8010 RepID=A0A6Q2ZQM2_ESOLU